MTSKCGVGGDQGTPAPMKTPSHHRAFNLVARRSASKHPADLYPARSRADRIFELDERLMRQFERSLAMLISLREMSAPAPVA